MKVCEDTNLGGSFDFQSKFLWLLWREKRILLVFLVDVSRVTVMLNIEIVSNRIEIKKDLNEAFFK